MTTQNKDNTPVKGQPATTPTTKGNTATDQRSGSSIKKGEEQEEKRKSDIKPTAATKEQGDAKPTLEKFSDTKRPTTNSKHS